jgi:hypothetical protein
LPELVRCALNVLRAFRTADQDVERLFVCCGCLDDDCAENFYWRSEFLSLSRRSLNFTGHIHASYHMTKYRETLAIGVSFAGEVEFGLFAETDVKIRCSRIGETTSHGEGTVCVMQTGDAGALERDWRKAIFRAVRVDGRLDDFNFYRLVRLVLRGDSTVKGASIVKAAVDIAEEVCGGRRGLNGVEFNFDITQLRVKEHMRV